MGRSHDRPILFLLEKSDFFVIFSIWPYRLTVSRLSGDPPKRRGHFQNMFYTYVLKSKKNGRIYIGSTDNLKRRLLEHNQGRGGKYTSNNKPFEIIYYESYLTYDLAKKSEKFFKTGYGRDVLKDKLSKN